MRYLYLPSAKVPAASNPAEVWDGALIGKHRASVMLDNTVRLPCGNSKVVVIEVKPGDNELDIEMNQ